MALEPMVRARIDELFSPGESGGRCPGEADCKMFASADPEAMWEGQLVGQAIACIPCDLKHTKPTPRRAELEGLLDQIEQLAAEQEAGFTRSVNEVSPLLFEGTVFWTKYLRWTERAQQRAWLMAMAKTRV